MLKINISLVNIQTKTKTKKEEKKMCTVHSAHMN